LEGSNVKQGMSDLKEGKRPMVPPSDLSVKAGSLLFKEGDLSREVYIVKQGTLSVSQRRGSQQIELARLQDRAVLGEMSLLDNQPRSATVRAITDCQLTVIAPATFQTMLHLIPAWLLAVLKVVTHRLRDTNNKIHQHTVPDALESFCVYLVEKCRVFSLHNTDTPHFSWFALLDEFCLLTRLKREDVLKVEHQLAARKLCKLSNQHELTIFDPDLILILRDWLSCKRKHQAYPFANLDPFIPLCCTAYSSIPPEALLQQEALLEYLQKNVDQRVSPLHILKMKEIGILMEAPEGSFTTVPNRITLLQKSMQELTRITIEQETET